MDKIPDTEPETLEAPEVVVEEAPRRAIAADEGIDGLKKQLEAEKTARAAAEAKAYKASNELAENEILLVSRSIETVKGHNGALKSAIIEAASRGDHTKAENLREELAANAARLVQLESGHQAMAERAKSPPPGDAVEDFARQLTPRSAAWVRAHPECVNDPRMHRKMLRAHEDAIDDGIPPDTKDYFAAVEARLGINNRDTRDEYEDDGEDEATELAAKPVARRSSPAAAPVSRSAPTSSGTGTRVIRLSADEREMARLSKMTDKEYYDQKMRVARENPRLN